ncbi:MAG TPA: VacJ family lipoprotein [Steroidobacteraceae bacterium]|nr:VacJ family lipoprotein [Steroidobacteraceae bacterium]
MNRSRIAAACAATLALGLAGCATAPGGKHDPRDPFERFNRGVYRFNTAADRAVLRPAARAWKAAVPAPVRRGLGNFIGNLGYPVTIVNDLLQGKMRQGADDFSRLLVNSIAGLGFLDPASSAGLERHDEDFGQTLAKWGVPAGPYLMLPFLGPSSMRDAPAKLADEYSDGRHYLQDPYLRWGLWGADKVELRASLLDADAALERTYDPYAFVRNAWLQRREYQVRDGAVDDSDVDTGADAPADAPDDAPAPTGPPAGPPRH